VRVALNIRVEWLLRGLVPERHEKVEDISHISALHLISLKVALRLHATETSERVKGIWLQKRTGSKHWTGVCSKLGQRYFATIP
jgi:hypothetical protein